MRIPRVRFTVRRLMIAVAVVAILLPWAIYLWQIYQNWMAYSKWASSPNRSMPYRVPYPDAGRWPF
jgi:hypothetical protein